MKNLKIIYNNRINIQDLENIKAKGDILLRKNVTVTARMLESGNIVPLEIFWDDGRKFMIDKILDKRRAASTKGGGAGIRYTVRICGHEKYLFLDDYTWFVEI